MCRLPVSAALAARPRGAEGATCGNTTAQAIAYRLRRRVPCNTHTDSPCAL